MKASWSGAATLVLASMCVFVLVGCPDSEPSNPDGGTSSDVNHPQTNFNIIELDPSARGDYQISLAVNKNDVIGVSYYVEKDSTLKTLRYAEYQAGDIKIETIMDDLYVQKGVSLGFNANNQPVVGYLGTGQDSLENPHWKQSDAVLTTRTASGWTEIGRVPNGAAIGNSGECSVSANPEFGNVVGLWPAMAFNSEGDLFMAFRDVHGAQFPTDKTRSFVELISIKNGSSNPVTEKVYCSFDIDNAYGSMNSMAISDNGVVGIAWSRAPESYDPPGNGIYFTYSNSNGDSFADPIPVRDYSFASNTMRGPSLAWHAGTGFAIAYQNTSSSKSSAELGLFYVTSSDGKEWSSSIEPIFVVGSGGFDPSLAFNSEGIPTVAYYFCSQRVGIDQYLCPASERVLRLAVRNPDSPTNPWTDYPVDYDGGHWTKLAYLSDGRAVLAYRDFDNQKIKLAIQK